MERRADLVAQVPQAAARRGPPTVAVTARAVRPLASSTKTTNGHQRNQRRSSAIIAYQRDQRVRRAFAAWIRAVMFARWLQAVDYHRWPDWPLWRAVGLCEQSLNAGEPDPWGDGIAWAGTSRGGTAGSSYPGGLGLSRDFWRMFAPGAGVTVTNGALASPADQIRAARNGSQNGTRMGGWSSWPGCVHAKGG